MTKRLAALVFVLIPLAADAQTRPLPTVLAPGTAGIVVQGRGLVRFPVKTVQFYAQARGTADERDVLAAMRAAGVENPAVGPNGPTLSQNAPTLVRGTVRDATLAKLEAIGLAAAAYVRAHPGLTVDNVSFAATSDGCAAHEQDARAAALADARRRADAIAALTNLTIDGVAGVNENGGCVTTDAPYQAYGGPGAGGLDLATLTSSVQVFETVTFAVSPRPGP
ncbi:MAG TPA: SIMPL domain-containing protein [Candidatus Elarobacter sp.]|nr:SIMPL domain-containing protein [Candidatus Elarobacter sp.]